MPELINYTKVRVFGIILFLVCNLIPAIGETEPSDFNRAVNFVKEKHYTKAANLFMSLAKQNDYQAQYNLALLLRKGLGYPANYSKALYWVLLAELSGLNKAVKLREELLGLVPDETADLVKDNISKILQIAMGDCARMEIENICSWQIPMGLVGNCNVICHILQFAIYLHF